MKQVLKNILPGLFAALFCVTAFSQIQVPPALAQKLQGKNRVEDIMREVNAFYKNGVDLGNEEKEEQYLFWKRWEYWTRRRLNADGSIGDFNKRNVEGILQIEKKFGEQMKQEAPKLSAARGTNRNGETNRTSNTELSYGDWSFLALSSNGTAGTSADINGLGRCDRIFFHPSNGNIFFVGAPDGGIWKTTDGGSTWTSISDGLPAIGVAGLVVSPTDANVIYVLSGDGDSPQSAGYFVFDHGYTASCQGVFKTTDGGATWTKTGDLYTGGSFIGHKLAISATNGNYLFAATDQGLYRTTNGGNNWTQVRTGLHWDVEFRPNDDSTIYASQSTSVAYSYGGGRSGTWNNATFNFSIAAANRIELGVRRNNLGVQSTYVYALCGPVTVAGQFKGLFRSTDIGQTYQRQSNTPNILGSEVNGSDGNDQSNYDLGITVRPTNVDSIATCGLNVWRSADAGVTMIDATLYRESYGPAGGYIHPDVHDVQYNPVNSYLYAVSDGGVYRSTDGGVNWTNLNSGVNTSQFYHFKMRDTDADGYMDDGYILGGAQDNGIKYRQVFAGSWTHVYCCDGFDGVINSDNPNIFYFNINNRLKKSTDGGATVNSITNTAYLTPMAIDWSNPDTVYVASGGTLIRTYDGFTGTTNLAIDVSDAITTCPSNTARLYGASGSTFRRSDDRGTSWTTLSTNPGWPTGISIVTDCKPLPTNSLQIVVSIGGYVDGKKIYYSSDGGANWTNYTGSLPNVAFFSVCVTSEGIYAGSDIGVFFRGWSMTDWTPFYNGLPRVAVSGIWAHSNGSIYCSTFGRGIYVGNRYSTCAATLSISGSKVGQWYYEASTSISATITSQGGAGSEIFAKAGSYVDLLAGFEIKNGTFFKAYTGPCSTGGIPTTARINGQDAIYYETPVLELNNGKAKPRSNKDYVVQDANSLEVFVTQPGFLTVSALDKNNNPVDIVRHHLLTAGLYRIIFEPGEYSKASVLFNNYQLPQLATK